MINVLTPAYNPFIFGADDLIRQFLQNPKSQGILLTGPKGVGKMTLAYHLARTLLHQSSSENPQSLFTRIAANSHGDLKVIQSEGTGEDLKKRKNDISVEAIRSVVHFSHATSFEGGWRIIIIDSIDELSLKAANALLKTLEEPPKKTLLILIAHHLGSILPTLRSRCALYTLSPLSSQEMEKALNRLLPEITAEEKIFLIQHAEGCPGQAIALKNLGGLSFYTSLLKAFKDLMYQDLRSIYDLIHHLKIDADIYNSFFSFFLRWWSGVYTSVNAFELDPLEKEILKTIHRKYTPFFIAQFYQHGCTLLHQISQFNLDPRQVLLCFFYELMTEQLNCTIEA